MKRFVLPAAVAIAVVAFAACGSDNGSEAPTATVRIPVVSPTAPLPTATIPPELFHMLQPGDDPAPPVGALDTSKSYTATIKTEKGDIKIELLDDIAPMFVENFINLSRIGFYDNTTFHRVIADFMAQGGDPTATGSGGPGYRFNDQFNPAMKFDQPGILAMANAGPNTNGSQFFITTVPTTWLEPYDAAGNPKRCGQIVNGQQVSCHGVFGKVVEGMDVVKSISIRNPVTDTTPGDKIITIEITES
jgi:cyclophilin family peptidyl-prolyl cis-trans isomerase